MLAALALTTLQTTIAADPFRIAVMHSDKKTLNGILHGDEFDLVADRLGWEKELFPYASFAELSERLSEFDIVAGAPLFFGDTSAFVEHAGKIREFIANGGALVIPEANYPAATSWLEKVDPKFKAYGNGRDSRHWPKQGPILTTPTHALYFLPNSGLQTESVTGWGDLEIDESLGWEVPLRSGNGKPSTAINRMGKGFVYVSNQRQGNPQGFENIRANLELQRLGLIATAFSMPALGFNDEVKPTMAVGSGELSVQLKSQSSVGPVSLELEITPESGDPQSFRTHGELTHTIHLKLPYRASARGPARVILRVKTREGTATIIDRKVIFPDLITLHPPRYRGLLAQNRRMETVGFRISIAHDQESLSGSKVVLKFASSGGGQAAPPVEHTPTSFDFTVPAKLDSLSPGDYTATAELRNASGVMATSEAKFTVLDKAPNQVIVDDDLALLVNGQPFFPIGIYHMQAEDLPAIAELGFNTVQGWEWGHEYAQNFLDAAQTNELKVILEMGNILRRSQEIPQLVAKFKNHPALLAWYVFDEPYEAQHLFCESVRDRFHAADPNHPTFMLSFAPERFRQEQTLGDIFSVDPYPLPNPMLTGVTKWTKQAVEATRGNRPVWLVNQSFGMETPEQLRAMAYLSLVNGARGFLWYPWNDGEEEKKGLKHHPHLHATVKALTAEIKELAPLLLGQHRRSFSLEGGNIHGIFLADENGRHLIAVNESPESSSGTIEIPGAPPSTVLKAKSGTSELSLSAGKVNLELGPYEVKHYRW